MEPSRKGGPQSLIWPSAKAITLMSGTENSSDSGGQPSSAALSREPLHQSGRSFEESKIEKAGQFGRVSEEGLRILIGDRLTCFNPWML